MINIMSMLKLFASTKRGAITGMSGISSLIIGIILIYVSDYTQTKCTTIDDINIPLECANETKDIFDCWYNSSNDVCDSDIEIENPTYEEIGYYLILGACGIFTIPCGDKIISIIKLLYSLIKSKPKKEQLAEVAKEIVEIVVSENKTTDDKTVQQQPQAIAEEKPKETPPCIALHGVDKVCDLCKHIGSTL
jgi:hypothetical protein